MSQHATAFKNQFSEGFYHRQWAAVFVECLQANKGALGINGEVVLQILANPRQSDSDFDTALLQ